MESTVVVEPKDGVEAAGLLPKKFVAGADEAVFVVVEFAPPKVKTFEAGLAGSVVAPKLGVVVG